MVAGAGLGVESHVELGFGGRDIRDLQQEVALPGKAVEFAVGDDLQPHLFLHAHDLADGRMLDIEQLLRRHGAGFGGLPRIDQRLGTDEAADLVGAKRRRYASGHFNSLTMMAPRAEHKR